MGRWRKETIVKNDHQTLQHGHRTTTTLAQHGIARAVARSRPTTLAQHELLVLLLRALMPNYTPGDKRATYNFLGHLVAKSTAYNI